MANLSGPDAYVPTDDSSAPDNNPTDNQPGPAANPDFLDSATGRQG
jgi:penicillin-binding protein 1A